MIDLCFTRWIEWKWTTINFPLLCAYMYIHTYTFSTHEKDRKKKHVMGERLGESWIIICYLDNPPAQNYRSKSETAIIIAGCLNVRRFQFFSPFQFPHFGLLSFFAVWSFFFAVSLVFFAVSKPANIQNDKLPKLFGRTRMPPAIVIQ